MSDDVFSMASEEADNRSENASDADKLSVAKLAETQLSLSNEIDNIENLLKEKKKELQRIEEHDLPEAMDRIGMSEFKLVDGTKISISAFYNASITGDRKEEAFNWLEDKGHGSLIKAKVEAEFGRNEIELAKQFLEFARGFNGLTSDLKFDQSIHWATLRAFVKEQVEEGTGLPLDLFGVYIGRKAKIKKG